MFPQKNSIYTYVVALSLSTFSFVSCEKEEDLFQSVLGKPDVPEQLSITEITDSSLVVRWEPLVTNEGVKNYLVYQNNVQVALDSVANYKAINLEPDSDYIFSVRAINRSDKISNFSEEVSAKTLQNIETETTPEPEPEQEPEQDRVLVFTKTAEFRHTSIAKGIETFFALGAQNDFEVIATENAIDFNANNLSTFKAVIFLSTTGDVLNAEEQEAFENYIQNGGSYMGVHAATDTEYDWPWYGQLVGAYFNGHPAIQQANIAILDQDHPATQHLQNEWVRTDEWYNFKDINTEIDVLLALDETSYEGGTNGVDHPIAWYHQFDGGRSFYTGGGHSEAAFDEPDFQKHLLGGLLYCLRR